MGRCGGEGPGGRGGGGGPSGATSVLRGKEQNGRAGGVEGRQILRLGSEEHSPPCSDSGASCDGGCKYHGLQQYTEDVLLHVISHDTQHAHVI